jgi:hypothetical protein
MAEADTALGKFSQQYGDRAFTVEPADGGYVFVRADHVDVDASGCLLIYGHTPERDGGMLLAALGQGQWNSIWVCDPASNTPLALVGNIRRQPVPGSRPRRPGPFVGVAQAHPPGKDWAALPPGRRRVAARPSSRSGCATGATYSSTKRSPP